MQDCTLDIIACPECGAPAEVVDRFALDSTDGPIEHLTVIMHSASSLHRTGGRGGGLDRGAPCRSARPAPSNVDGVHTRTPSPPWSCGWRGRTRAGDTCGCAASCSSSATAWVPRRSVGSCSATGSHQRRRGTPTPVGGSSCASEASSMLAVDLFHVDCAVTPTATPVRDRGRRPLPARAGRDRTSRRGPGRRSRPAAS
jgi:hypothetical protein